MIPHEAKTKLTRLEFQATEMDAAINATLQKLGDWRNGLEAGASSMNEKMLAERVAEIEDAEEYVRDRRRHAGNARQVLTAVKGWLANPKSDGAWETVMVKPRLKSGEAVPDAVDRVRAEITRLTVEQRKVNRAPLAIDERKAAAEARIRQMADKARPRYKPDGTFQLGYSPEFSTTITAGDLIAWLDPDRMIAAVHRDLDAMPAQADEITTEEREKRLAELARDKLAMEREEESLVEMAAAMGHLIARRPQADPRAVLAIGRTKKAAAKAA